MNWIFWGTALVLLDWDVTLGSATFDLLPDFLGLVLLRRGLERNAERFGKVRHFAFAMELAAFLLYGARLLRPDPMSRVVIGTVNLLLRAAFLVLLYFVLRGTDGGKQGAPRDAVRGMYAVLAVLQPICLAIQWIPLIGPVSKIASAVFALCFLIAFGSYLKKQ